MNRYRLFFLFLAPLMCANTHLALAGDTHVEVTGFPDFTVKSNGSQYTSLSGSSFEWSANLHIHEETAVNTTKPIKSWRVTPRLKRKDASGNGEYFLEMSGASDAETYKIFDRPGIVTEDIGRQFSSALVQTALVEICEENADQLRETGITDQEIFSQDWEIKINVDLDLDADFVAVFQPLMQALNETFFDESTHHSLTCQKWGGANVPTGGSDIALKNGVTDFTFDVEEKVTGSFCGLKLTGHLFTALADTTVSFRYEEQNTGYKSALYEVTTLPGITAPGPYVGFFSHQFPLPNTDGGVQNGKIRIIGVSHPFNSGWQSYSADCNPPVTDTLQTELPPDLEFNVTPQDNVLVDGQICPSRVKMVAGIKAKSSLNGDLIFVGNSYFSKLHPVQLANGHSKQYGDYREISWETSSGINTEAQPLAGEPALKKQSITLGYNITNEEGSVVYQVVQKSFQLGCVKPSLNPGLQLSEPAISANLKLHNLSAGTIPKATASGSQCGVEVKGEFETSHKNVTINFALHNQQNKFIRTLTAKSDASKKGYFSTYIDFRKRKVGRWIGQNGNFTFHKPQQAGTYEGNFRLSATGVQVAPRVLTYQVLCHTRRVYGSGDGIGGFAGSNQQAGNQDAVLSASVLTTRKNLVVARQDKIRRIKKPARNLSVASALTTSKPTKKPTRAADKKALAHANAVIAKPKKIIDLAVQQVSGVVKKGKGSVVVDIANIGNARGGGSLQVLVKNQKGKIIKRHTARIVLKKGKTKSVTVPFTFKKGRIFKVSATLQIKGDTNPKNNSKNRRLRRT